MILDKNATQYQFNNGRFDLMTDEEVRTIDGDDLASIVFKLGYLMHESGESSIGEDLWHRLYELKLRYPETTFRLEVMKTEHYTEEEEETRR